MRERIPGRTFREGGTVPVLVVVRLPAKHALAAHPDGSYPDCGLSHSFPILGGALDRPWNESYYANMR